MRFLVLGGNGYLGSKVVHKLVEKGEDVICTIRTSSNLSRLSDIMNNIIVIQASVDAISATFHDHKVDWVINMACTYGRGTVLYDSVIESNIEFPLYVLNMAVEYGVENFLTIGTGLPDNLNMYSFSKKMFSDLGEFYSDKHGINFINMKLEMFYGSDEPEDRFIPNIILKMINNEPVQLTEGIQHRDIVAVIDIVNAIIYTVYTNLKGYWLIPVGTGEAPTIREIIEYIYNHLGSCSKLEFGAVPMRIGEPNCCADTRILTEIGYSCKYSWRQGIAEMSNELKNRYSMMTLQK